VRYYSYIKNSVDQFVSPDGSIPTRNVEEFQLDSILLGRQLLLLYGVTRDARYAKAAMLLYQLVPSGNGCALQHMHALFFALALAGCRSACPTGQSCPDEADAITKWAVYSTKRSY
jgi:hypothetical protein